MAGFGARPTFKDDDDALMEEALTTTSALRIQSDSAPRKGRFDHLLSKVRAAKHHPTAVSCSTFLYRIIYSDRNDNKYSDLDFGLPRGWQICRKQRWRCGMYDLVTRGKERSRERSCGCEYTSAVDLRKSLARVSKTKGLEAKREGQEKLHGGNQSPLRLDDCERLLL